VIRAKTFTATPLGNTANPTPTEQRSLARVRRRRIAICLIAGKFTTNPIERWDGSFFRRNAPAAHAGPSLHSQLPGNCTFSSYFARTERTNRWFAVCCTSTTQTKQWPHAPARHNTRTLCGTASFAVAPSAPRSCCLKDFIRDEQRTLDCLKKISLAAFTAILEEQRMFYSWQEHNRYRQGEKGKRREGDK